MNILFQKALFFIVCLSLSGCVLIPKTQVPSPVEVEIIIIVTPAPTDQPEPAPTETQSVSPTFIPTIGSTSTPSRLIINYFVNKQCIDGKPQVTISVNPTGGSPDYSIDPNRVFQARAGDTVKITVNSADGQTASVLVQIPKVDCQTEDPPTVNEMCGNNQDDNGDGRVDEGCPIESCGNNVDDDSNGQIDEGCPKLSQEVCGNNKDDDNDGQIDEDCPIEICGNNIDDDGDGQTDEECPQETCENGRDDDGDGWVDEGCPRTCKDGIDNDLDGNTDWPADSSCHNRNDVED